MKKNYFFTYSKMCLLTIVGVLLASCADTYSGGDTFVSDVKNTTLQSPTESDITVTPSSDGSTMTIEWKVIFGAGGYEFILTNLSDEANPLVSKVVDGCKITVDREEDVNYRISVRTLGNIKLNNTEASAATIKDYSTFTATYARIPAGDIYEYFQNNPIPDEATEELNFDLESKGQYTLSKPLEFNYHKVVFRTSDKLNHAVIKISEDANFVASNDFTLKYVDIDASATTRPVVEAYKYETAPDGILEKPGNYYLINFIRFMDCKFTGVVGSLFYDNNKSYAIVNLQSMKRTKLMR